MSKFWEAYGSVNDDIRHHLVEKAWFGQNAGYKEQTQWSVTPGHGVSPEQSSSPSAVATSAAPSSPDPRSLYSQTWGQEPSSTDLYGNRQSQQGPSHEL